MNISTLIRTLSSSKHIQLDVRPPIAPQDLPANEIQEHGKKSTCEGAAENGHLDVLQWARAQDPPCPWDAGFSKAAAKYGHLDVLTKLLWIDSKNPRWRKTFVKGEAAEKGDSL